MRLVLAVLLCLSFVAVSEAGLFRKRCGGKRKPVRNVVKAVVPNGAVCPGGQCTK